MLLLLMRHGEAVAEAVDNQRPLSGSGVEEVGKIAARVGEAGFEIANIFYSTKKRARQTAQIMRDRVCPGAAFVEKDCLGPGDPLDRCWKEIGSLTVNTLLVGHLPFLSHLLSRLVVGDERKEVVRFSTATVVVLERVSAEGWAITSVLSPSGTR